MEGVRSRTCLSVYLKKDRQFMRICGVVGQESDMLGNIYMTDINLFRINGESVTQLEGQSVALEKSLQRLIEKHLDVFLGIRRVPLALPVRRWGDGPTSKRTGRASGTRRTALSPRLAICPGDSKDLHCWWIGPLEHPLTFKITRWNERE